jgi:hypothetical protein
MPPASGWSDRSKVMAPKPVGAERSRRGRSLPLFAVEHADRMRTVTRAYARVAEFLRQCPQSVPAL